MRSPTTERIDPGLRAPPVRIGARVSAMASPALALADKFLAQTVLDHRAPLDVANDL